MAGRHGPKRIITTRPPRTTRSHTMRRALTTAATAATRTTTRTTAIFSPASQPTTTTTPHRPRLPAALLQHPFFLPPLFAPAARAAMSSTTTPASSARDDRGAVLKRPVRIACVQLSSGPDKAANLSRARARVLSAARDGGAHVVVLPECFNSPYGTAHFPAYAERLLPSPPPADASPSYHALAAAARDAGVYLVAGSIPELALERDGDDGAEVKRYYNTALVFSPTGDLLATHRKVHLFDINIPGKITFRESDVLSPGSGVTLVDLPPYGRVGVAICYDVRFPELAAVASRRGAFALVYPGAFNLTTGPLHWELLARARAVDNQLYVALCSPARDLAEGAYHAYGHSLVAGPMADVLVEAGEGEETVYADLRPEDIESARSGIPLRTQRRFDVYPDVSQGRVKFTDPGADGR
ncbi:hypothetical protein RB594_008256 [Gaeumannomyces avenae]